MGYHVSIINNLNIPYTDKILYNTDLVIRKMLELGFEVEDNNGFFFYKKDGKFAIFYDDHCLWVLSPDKNLLISLIEIANSFNDGSQVVGDKGEIYENLSDVCSDDFIVQEPSEKIIKKVLMFLYYRIWFIIPILLVSIKFFI